MSLDIENENTAASERVTSEPKLEEILNKPVETIPVGIHDVNNSTFESPLPAFENTKPVELNQTAAVTSFKIVSEETTTLAPVVETTVTTHLEITTTTESTTPVSEQSVHIQSEHEAHVFEATTQENIVQVANNSRPGDEQFVTQSTNTEFS